MFVSHLLKLTAAVIGSLAFSHVAEQASAHVVAVPNTRDLTTASAITQFLAPHPCESTVNGTTVEYETIGLSIDFPLSVSSVKPQFVEGWNVTMSSTAVTSSSGAANQVTVNWTKIGGFIPDGTIAVFPVYFSVADTTQSQTIVFPVIQLCEEGQSTAYTLSPAEVASMTMTEGEDMDMDPAPYIKFTHTTPLSSDSQITSSQLSSVSAISSSSESWSRSDTLSVVAIALSATVIIVFVLRVLMKWLNNDTNAMDAHETDKIVV